MPTLLYNNDHFIFNGTFDERLIAKNAGFKWDVENKMWYTNHLDVAARLRDYATGLAKTKLNETLIHKSPWTAPFPLTPNSAKLFPHQVEAIAFALERNKCYLGLDPGLGKTACAAMVSNALQMPTVYICPPFLMRNVEESFKFWTPHLTTSMFSGLGRISKSPNNFSVLIVPDSILMRINTLERIEDFVSNKLALLVVDEAHRFKNIEAKRTSSLFGTKSIPGIITLFDRQIYMSGTPMPNRPMELFPILSHVAPETIDFMSMFGYGRKYCAGHRDGFGWDFTGASNMPELSKKVIAPTGPFMLRMKKELLNLPPKIEEIFVVSANMGPQLSKFDSSIAKMMGDGEDVMKIKLAVNTSEGDLHVASYRRLLGIEKAHAMITYIKSLMEETEENILIFAYHKEVIEKLEMELLEYKPFVITGQTPVDKRQDMVNEFQDNKKRRLFIGNYLAMGTGFTLTKANRVIFVEFDWVPGNNQQASDRAHRIGQTASVLVQYVAYRDSIDKKVIETLLRKNRAIAHI